MAGTKWVMVDMLQSRPMDIGLDTAGRPTLSFNAIVTKRPSEKFEEEVASVLIDAGVGGLNATIFAASQAQVPAGAGPFLSILSTGGPGPLNRQNTSGIGYERAGLQIVVRGANYRETRTMALNAYAALAPVRNQSVVAA